MPWVNDPNAPGGRRWVEDGQGVEPLQTGQVFIWGDQQYQIPDDQTASGFGGGPAPSSQPQAHQPAPLLAAPDRPIIPSTADRSTRGESIAADVLNMRNVPFSPEWWLNQARPAINMGIQANNWLNEPTVPSQAQPSTSQPESAPQLDLGPQISPIDQALIDTLTQLQAQGAPQVTAPQLPDPMDSRYAGMYAPDPALQTMVDHATRRQGQIDELLAELRGDIEGRRMRTENKWWLLGRWLSDWAATDDPTQAGAAMSRAIAENDDLRRDLRNETLALTQMGWQAEDAVVQAQANLLSGQSVARREQAQAGYNRDTAQAGLDFQASTANANAASNAARANAALTAQIAELTAAATERGQQRSDQVAQMLMLDPRFSGQASQSLAGGYSQDPATQGAVAGALQSQVQAQALMAAIGGATDPRSRRAVLNTLREFDPTIRESDLRAAQSNPALLLSRVLRSPNRDEVFARHPELLYALQFGGGAPMAPSQ